MLTSSMGVNKNTVAIIATHYQIVLQKYLKIMLVEIKINEKCTFMIKI